MIFVTRLPRGWGGVITITFLDVHYKAFDSYDFGNVVILDVQFWLFLLIMNEYGYHGKFFFLLGAKQISPGSNHPDLTLILAG